MRKRQNYQKLDIKSHKCEFSRNDQLVSHKRKKSELLDKNSYKNLMS